MSPIRLITFDIYGTLLDWQSYVEEAFPGRYGAFLRASAARQDPHRPFLTYTDLLAEVALELSPQASPALRQFFSTGIGLAKPFADSRALQQLQTMAMLGCATNSDYRHLADAQKSLGVAFDVTLMAEDLRAYKPHAQAWDQMVDFVTKRLGYDKSAWLHVAAYTDFDLTPAKERGVTTCFLPRPGGSEALDAERLPADHVVSDLWQLVDLVRARNGSPIRYEVEAETRDAATAADFLSWMRYEHGPDLLGVRGCVQFQAVRLKDTLIRCEYVFVNQAALDEYLAGPAAAMRQKGKDRYGEDRVQFTRRTGEIESGYRLRTRQDFSPPRPGKTP